MKLICENLNLYGIMEPICEIIGLILQTIKLIYQSTQSPPPVHPVLSRLCRHQLIQPRILRELVDKRHEGAAIPD